MNKNSVTYEKIERVLIFARKPLAKHEFRDVMEPVINENGLSFIGITEETLGRRLREMRVSGRVASKRRDGKAFVEYTLPVPVKSESEFPAEQVAA